MPSHRVHTIDQATSFIRPVWTVSLLALGLMTSVVLVGVKPAAAATACPAGANVWTGAAGDGSWGTPKNWSQGNAPGTSSTTQDVCLPDSASPYAVTLAPFQYVNSINNPPLAHISANSLTVGTGASLIIRGASSNDNYSSSGGDATSLALANGGTISAGGTLELLATDDNDGGGASDNGGRGVISGTSLTNAGTFTSVSQTTQGAAQGHQNELGISLTDLPGSSTTVVSGTLRVDQANRVTNEGTWSVASAATVLTQYNGFNQSGVPATSFVNDGSYINSGATVMNQSDHGGVGDQESDPITWFQQGGSVTGNPIQLTDGAELNDAAGTGAFLFNDQEGQIAGTIPTGQTVTVEADAYGPNSYLNTVALVGPQVVNQGTFILHIPNVSADDQTAIRITGAQLINQGTVTAVADVPNLVNELDVAVTNAHGGGISVSSGTLMATNGQTVTNDGTIFVTPGAQFAESANQFLTGPETFTNAADGTIETQIAGPSSYGTVQIGGDSTVSFAGTVTPSLVGGFVPAPGTTFATFPVAATPTPTINGTFAAVGGGFTADYSHEKTSPAYIALVYGAPGTTAPVAAAPRPSMLSVGKVSVKGTTLQLTLTCSAGAGCPRTVVQASIRVREKGNHILGIATHTTRSTKQVKVKVVVVGVRIVRLGAGKHADVTVTLNAAGRRLLAQFHRLRLAVTVSTGGKIRRTITVRVNQARTGATRHSQAAGHFERLTPRAV